MSQINVLFQIDASTKMQVAFRAGTYRLIGIRNFRLCLVSHCFFATIIHSLITIVPIGIIVTTILVGNSFFSLAFSSTKRIQLMIMLFHVLIQLIRCCKLLRTTLTKQADFSILLTWLMLLLLILIIIRVFLLLLVIILIGKVVGKIKILLLMMMFTGCSSSSKVLAPITFMLVHKVKVLVLMWCRIFWMS